MFIHSMLFLIIILSYITLSSILHLTSHHLYLLLIHMSSVKMDFLSTAHTIHFIVMSSVFDTEKPIHIKYDLKGSTVGRVSGIYTLIHTRSIYELYI